MRARPPRPTHEGFLATKSETDSTPESRSGPRPRSPVDRWTEALARLEAARRAAADTSAAGTIPAILLQMGELHLRLGDAAAASEDFATALIVAESTSNAAARAAALNGMGRIHYRTGDPGAARRALLNALEAAPDTAEALQAAVRHNLGVAANATGALDAARLFWMDALSRFAALNDAGGLARVYNNLGVNSMARGEWPESEIYLRQALTAAQSAADAETARCVRLNLAARALARGELDSALDELARAAAPIPAAPPLPAATMPLGLRLLEASWVPAPLDDAGG